MVVENIEKNLKRFLKRKISVNESVVVKFLITGLIGASLTACGGGGGGGGSSSGGVTPLPKPVEKPVEDIFGKGEVNNENIIINGDKTDNKLSNTSAITAKNSTITNEANLKLGGEKVTAISAINSTVTNNSDITLSGEKSIALKGEVSTVLRNKAFEISVENKGNITLDGKNQIGMLVISKSGLISGINSGTISVTKNLEEDNDTSMEEYFENFAFGMVGSGAGSTIVNSKDININGSAIGMYTKDGKAINNGNIDIKSEFPDSEKSYKTPVGMVAERDGVATNNGTITGTGDELQGMFAYNGGTVINGKDGKIELKGDMVSALNGFNGTVINDGEIIITDGGNGIEIDEGIATNNGVIKVSGNYARGINSGNADVTNNKDIFANGDNSAGLYTAIDESITPKKVSLINEVEGTLNIKGNYSSGIENHCSSYEIINKGLIDVSGTNTTGIYSYGDNTKIENTGDIKLGVDISKFDSNYSGDTGIDLIGNNTTIVNNGNINLKLDGSNSKVDRIDHNGILAEGSNNTIKNNGKIEIIGNINQSFSEWITFSGINSYGYADKNESFIENGADGEIIININSSLDLENITVRGIHSDLANITINNLGNISIKGIKNVVGISGVNSVITNSGNITVEGDDSAGINCSGGDIGSGIASSSESTITNSGKIEIIGGNTAGIHSFADNTTVNNTGDIILKFKDTEFTSGQYSNVTGILTEGNNNKVTNNGRIEITGNIDLPYPENQAETPIYYFYGIRSNNQIEGTNNVIENGKDGEIIINIDKTVENANIFATGIHSNFAGTTINNLGKITISGVNDSSGIYGYASVINNNGTITVNGGNNYGIQGNEGSIITNTGNIEMNGYYAWGISDNISSDDKMTTISNDGEIKIKGENGIGIYTISDSKITSTGKITIDGDYGIGIMGGNSQITNSGDIIITSENSEESLDPTVPHSTGIYLGTNDGTASVKNSGNIIMNGDKSVGVYAYNGKITNENGGIISVNGEMGTGLYISGNNGSATNNGEIIVTGNESDGMLAELNTTATNNKTITVIGENSSGMTASGGAEVINEEKGTINVDGKGSYGMKADGLGSTATNYGTINVGANASGGMLAINGGTISNEGKIYIDSSHGLDDSNKEDFALQSDENSTIKNIGEIISDQKVEISTGTNYIIGTNSDGSYGKVSAKDISVDGNVKLSTKIAEGSYEDTYTLEDVFSGNTDLKENYNLSSTSVLYKATSKLDEKGNLDAELSRNENNLIDFTSKEYDGLANLFDKGINDKEFRDKLSDEAKDVLNDVFANSSSEESIQNRIREISGVEYTNIARQMFDTKDIFKSYDSSIIDTLDDYKFNFNFIGNYSDVEAKNNLLGYESQMTGISGAMKFNDNLYGVIGYGYNDIDFDGNSEGNIQTVHTGVYKDMKLNSFDMRFGVFGEYNFHEVERNIVSAKGDFNSYLLGVIGEISQKFGSDLYVKPTLSLDVTYGKYQDFTEEGGKGYNLTLDSQDYASIVPAVELKVGKDFETISLYSAVKFGYEFGDMNKTQDIIFNEFGKYSLDTDNIENAQTDVKVGTAFEYNNFTFNAEVGKDFGKRDREYIKAQFTYTF